MHSCVFGKKIGMMNIFDDAGGRIPVTVLEIGPCYITQIKSVEKEKYNAIQVGYRPKKDKLLTKPLIGHFKAAGKGGFRHLKEIKVDNVKACELGQAINSDIFSIGDLVTVSSLSKGKGFTGVVKRWGYSGGPKTHGSRSHKVPGSLGASATPARIMKGKKLPGRKGYQKVTVKNLKVVDVVNDKNLVFLKGAVPGCRGSLVQVKINS